MQQYLEILRTCALFNSVGDEYILRMLTCFGARVEHFDKKYTIFSEGSPAKYIGIVLSGTVQAVQVDYYGNRSILSEFYPSETFGEAFACAEVSSLPVDVIANEPCDVMLIDASHILHTCENICGFHQSIIYNLMRELAKKTLLFHQRIEITSKRSTREKLLAYLTVQARLAGSNSFEIPFDRQELADFLEVERSGLSAEISKLRNEGVLESKKNLFVLL